MTTLALSPITLRSRPSVQIESRTWVRARRDFADRNQLRGQPKAVVVVLSDGGCYGTNDDTRTRRPHAPKSCSEFATTCIPSQSRLFRSSSLYSSITVGRKKTRRPPGLRRYRARTTRSVASADNSYGFVGGTYACGCCGGRGEPVTRSFFRPRRFAPARTPSKNGIRSTVSCVVLRLFGAESGAHMEDP